MLIFSECVRVTTWVRCLAVLYLFCLILAGWFAVLRLLNGLPISFPGQSESLVFGLLLAYLSFLFCYVAITGRNPVRYFPIGTISWPLVSRSNPRVLRLLGLQRMRRNRKLGKYGASSK